MKQYLPIVYKLNKGASLWSSEKAYQTTNGFNYSGLTANYSPYKNKRSVRLSISDSKNRTNSNPYIRKQLALNWFHSIIKELKY